MSLYLNTYLDVPELFYILFNTVYDATTLELIDLPSTSEDVRLISTLDRLRQWYDGNFLPIFILLESGSFIIVQPVNDTRVRILAFDGDVNSIFRSHIEFVTHIYLPTSMGGSIRPIEGQTHQFFVRIAQASNTGRDLSSVFQSPIELQDGLIISTRLFHPLVGPQVSVDTSSEELTSSEVTPITPPPILVPTPPAPRRPGPVSRIRTIRRPEPLDFDAPSPTPEERLEIFTTQREEGRPTYDELVRRHLQEQTDPLLQQSYEILLKRLYNQDVELPSELVVNNIRTPIIPFNRLNEIVTQNQGIARFHIEPLLQVWAGPPGTDNRMVTLFMNNGRTYLVKAKYNIQTNQLFLPE